MRSGKSPFKGRRFTAAVILWAVRWYLQFPISYRDLERMLVDRGVAAVTRPSSAGSRPTPRSSTGACARTWA